MAIRPFEFISGSFVTYVFEISDLRFLFNRSPEKGLDVYGNVRDISSPAKSGCLLSISKKIKLSHSANCSGAVRGMAPHKVGPSFQKLANKLRINQKYT